MGKVHAVCSYVLYGAECYVVAMCVYRSEITAMAGSRYHRRAVRCAVAVQLTLLFDFQSKDAF